jgi:hypothetical protein
MVVGAGESGGGAEVVELRWWLWRWWRWEW